MGNHVTFADEVTLDPATIKAAANVLSPGTKPGETIPRTRLLLDNGKDLIVSRVAGTAIHAHLRQQTPQ